MREFKAPQQIETRDVKSVFLAGTIDMGNSEDWQSIVKDYFLTDNVDIYNPRRDSWDSSCIQEFENPQFYQQVNWELSGLEKADYILVNFLQDSKSPITLLELGLFAKSGKLLVCCPKEFYRSGNIEILCDKYNIPLYRELSKLLIDLKYKLND